MKWILGGLLAVLVMIVGAVAAGYIGAVNSGNRMEQAIHSTYENNENILAQYGQKIAEAAQVPSIQRDDMIAVFSGAIESRYGADGSRAAMQWIQEQNPNLNQETYLQLMRLIEAGRNDFTRAQTRLTDFKRSYRTQLGSFWSGFWLSTAGYPKIAIGWPIGSTDDYPIISTDRASDAFRDGKESGPIKLR